MPIPQRSASNLLLRACILLVALCAAACPAAAAGRPGVAHGPGLAAASGVALAPGIAQPTGAAGRPGIAHGPGLAAASGVALAPGIAQPTGAAGRPGVGPTPDVPLVPGAEGVRYRRDALLLRLTPAAATVARERYAAAAPPRGDLPPLRAAAPRLAQLGLPAIDRVASDLGAEFEREFPDDGPGEPGATDFSRYWIAHLPPSAAPERALAAFRAAAEVDVARAIAVVPVVAVPNDSLWAKAYYFYQSSRRDLHAPEAWDVCRGDSSVVVAILDTGVLTSHPDLAGPTPGGGAGRIWTCWPEAGGLPGVDDDGNGFVDDAHGWDFVDLPLDTFALAGEDWRDEDNDPSDFASHGTAVAGLVGALTNNRIGVSAATWDVRIMPLRVGWSAPRVASGEVDLSYAARAIRYATRLRASVINISFSTIFQEDLDEAVTAATRAGVTTVAAAGNNGSVHAINDRNDVISVAATDSYDRITSFSNRGDYVDVAAPGYFTVTTIVDKDLATTDSVRLRRPGYAISASGTSFSSPLVAGEVALIQAYRRQRGLPPLRPVDVLLRVMDTADDISDVNPGLDGYGIGRVNYERALADPPTSFTAATEAITVGPAVVVNTLSGVSRFALATRDGRLLMLEGNEGTLVWSARLPGAPAGGVAAADLGDGLGLGLFVATEDGRIAGFDEAGGPLPGWPVQATRVSQAGSLEPALGDLDGDGSTEIVWGGNNGAVCAWRADGRPLAGFPRMVGAAGRNVFVALADLDGRPGLEIVAATSSGGVTVLRQDRTVLAGWPRATAPGPLPPAVTTLGSDPRPCVIVAASATVTVFETDGSTRWQRALDGEAAGPPAVGDLDGDGGDEIVVPQVPDRLVILDSDGARINSITVPGILAAGSVGAEPVIGTFRWGWPGVALNVGGSLRAWDLGGGEPSGFPRPGAAGAAPALADLDGDGRTEIVAGSGADSLVYVYDAGEFSWNPSLRGWPTPRGNNARTGSNLVTPAIVPLDDVPPGRVEDLAAFAPRAGEIDLHWNAPRDSGSGRAARYDARYALRPIGDDDFASATAVADLPGPAAAGVPESAVVTGIEEDRTYYFALRSADRAGNLSALSPSAAVTTLPYPPAPVTDLGVAGSTDSSLTLVWSASGDDGLKGRPARYLVRASGTPVSAATFDAAPIGADFPATRDAGGRESGVLAGFELGRRYWIAIIAEDAHGHRSPVSAALTARVGPLASRTALAIAPAVQPARPPIDLHWQLGPRPSGRPPRIEIFDVTGRLQKSIELETAEGGVVRWDGRDDDGRSLPSGLYFARIHDGRRWATTRVVLIG